MKIAMYAPSWPPSDDSNGIVTYLSHIIPELRRLGHEVYVLTFSPMFERLTMFDDWYVLTGS